MTSRTDSIPVALAPSGGFRWRRLVFSFLLTLLAMAVFAAAFVVGFVRMHDARVLPGVEVAGIALGGLDRHAAELKLRQELPPLSAGALTVNYAEVSEQIPYTAIGRDYNMGLMLDQAFALGHGGSTWDEFRAQLGILLDGVAVQPSVTWNGDQLVERLQALAEQVTVHPTDATLIREQGRYAAIPSSEGRSVDIEEGLTRALAAIDNTSPASRTIELDAIVLAPQITTAMAEEAVLRAERVTGEALALTGLGESTTISPETLRGWVRLDEAAVGSWPLVIGREPIVQYVGAFAEQINQPAINASFAFNDAGEVVAVAGQQGQVLDVEASADRVLAALQERGENGGSGGPVSLAIVITEPDFTTAEAKELAPKVEKISAWTTNFVPGVVNGNGRNIAIPTREIDGFVVLPGEEFDFLSVIGPITPERGYTKGAGIIRGQTNLDGVLGGGMCSTSTTLFNAALRAGLEMGKRANHYYYISRYPVGLDATVWYTGSSRVTMTFTNDTPYPILVRGINKPGAVKFQIWGVPTGRTVEFSRPRVENRRKAWDTIEWTDKLKPGELKRVEWPTDGFEAWVTRTVRDEKGNVIHQNTYYSRYGRVIGVTLKGRGPDDPRAGTSERIGGGGN